jgi:hypothetical protein
MNAHDGGEHPVSGTPSLPQSTVHREHSVQDDEIVVIRQLREAVVAPDLKILKYLLRQLSSGPVKENMYPDARTGLHLTLG